jgi:hypothetical protein
MRPFEAQLQKPECFKGLKIPDKLEFRGPRVLSLHLECLTYQVHCIQAH